MSRELVENVLTMLKTSTDKALTLRGLIKLRSDVVKDHAGIVIFRDAGGVPLMVEMLNKPYSKILEVALSILGNCCTDNTCCAQSFEARVTGSLAVIFKSIQNPLIQTRACRLLGNLAKFDHNLLMGTAFSSSTIAQSLCQIIKDTNDPQTRLMGMRACRFLLKSSVFVKYFLDAHALVYILQTLARLMKNDAHVEQNVLQEQEKKEHRGLKKNQHREKYFLEVARNLEGVRSDIFDYEMLKNLPRISNQYIPPKDKDASSLVCEIVRCLLIISENNLNTGVWIALEMSGVTLAPIVSLASTNNEHRSAALKILSNFSKYPAASSFLGTADAVVVACETLPSSTEENPISESERRHCLNVISHMSIDACSRSKIRRSGALKKLIAIARQSDSQTETSAILYALNNFQYDNLSMELMLSEGLIQLLIKELYLYLTSDDEYRKKKREERKTTATKKRKLMEDTSELFYKMAKTHYEPNIDNESPSTSSSPPMSPSSQCESRSMSPMEDRTFNMNDEDSDYSPVCSDDEGDEGKDDESKTIDHDSSKLYVNKDSNIDVFKLLDIACKTESNDDLMLDPKDDEDETSIGGASLKLPTFGNLSRNIIDIIENLFYRATLLLNKRQELGRAETLKTLIKAINTFGSSNNFAMALTNILQESQFFVHVIRQSIAHQLYQLTKLEETRNDGLGFLETLTCVGESNYGKAELAYLLRCDDAIAQKRAAITVAYIIKSHRLLRQFLEEGQALRLLLDIMLSESSDDTTVAAVDAFTSMCKNTLGISVKLPNTTVLYMQDFDSYREDDTKPLHENCDMNFLVFESGQTQPVTVKFNKDLLCKSSEVFNTMLNSNFREGTEGEIHLKTCTASGLRYFLNLLVRQSQNLSYNIPTEQKHHAVLEALEMSRVYIIPSLEAAVEQILMYLLDESNCLSVFEWSMENYHVELREMAINYFLCSALPADVKVELFQNALKSKFASEWHQMIRDSILDRCVCMF